MLINYEVKELFLLCLESEAVVKLENELLLFLELRIKLVWVEFLSDHDPAVLLSVN